jgi:hypothetical protein
MNKRFYFLAAVIGCLVYSSVSQAVPLVPGPGTVPVFGDSAPTGTVLQDVVTSFSSGAWAGTLRTVVIRDNSVANFGNIDFLYQITRTDPDPFMQHDIARLSVANYANYLTNVDYTTGMIDGIASGLETIESVDRKVPGTIGFNFSGSGLMAGQSTVWMFVKSNSTDIGMGNAHVIDDATADVSTFAPAPEPTSMTLLGLGCVGILGSYGWRRRQALKQ